MGVKGGTKKGGEKWWGWGSKTQPIGEKEKSRSREERRAVALVSDQGLISILTFPLRRLDQ